jgi:hypothetical protein
MRPVFVAHQLAIAGGLAYLGGTLLLLSAHHVVGAWGCIYNHRHCRKAPPLA